MPIDQPQPADTTTTVLGELHDILSTMLDDGIAANAPIRMRTHPREPNVHTGAPNTAPPVGLESSKRTVRLPSSRVSLMIGTGKVRLV